MAKAELLVQLVKYASENDQAGLRRIVESIAADERARKHTILSDRLMNALNHTSQSFISRNSKKDSEFIYQINPERELEDLVLSDSIIENCKSLVEEQHRSELLLSYGLSPRNRILLLGTPGNGKTSLAEVIATQLMYPLFVIRYESLIGSYLGETATRLQNVFDYARTQRCVLFFDEFDTLGKERSDAGETGEIKRVVSSLLLQIDKLPSYTVIICASNHPELLDKAVWRRFQIKMELNNPDKNQMLDYINRFEQRSGILFGGSGNKIIEKLKGQCFAELEEFCLQILRQAILKTQIDKPERIITENLEKWEQRYRIAEAAV